MLARLPLALKEKAILDLWSLGSWKSAAFCQPFPGSSVSLWFPFFSGLLHIVAQTCWLVNHIVGAIPPRMSALSTIGPTRYEKVISWII